MMQQVTDQPPKHTFEQQWATAVADTDVIRQTVYILLIQQSKGKKSQMTPNTHCIRNIVSCE